jgi:hypothetical protein
MKRSPLKRKTKLAPFADKLRNRMIEYGKIRKDFLLDKNYTCEVCGNSGDQVHHKEKRGKNLCIVSTFMCVCGLCHRKIHDNPAWARDKGYLIYKFK